MKTLAKTFKIMGVITFAICLLILKRRYDVGVFYGFLIIGCPCILAYMQGLVENMKSKYELKPPK